MDDIIQYFSEICINKFLELQKEYYKELTDFTKLELGTMKIVNDLGREFISYVLKEIDQSFRDSSARKEKWHIESRDTKHLITVLGEIEYSKTLFTSKTEKTPDGKEEMHYLLDDAIGFKKNQRISEASCARIYTEAVQTSYRKGGEVVSIEDKVTKQAVKDLLHKTEFPPNFVAPKEKKTVDYLYIDADEDHYSLQFRNKKGDIEKDEQGHKKNGAITKIIYVYEGVEPEASKSKRYRLINPHYFCRGDSDNVSLWDEVYSYIEATYDLSKVKKIYLNSDGGGWIKAGYRRIQGIEYVLDEFHLSKYLLKLTSHMLDSQGDAKDELLDIIKKGNKSEFTEKVEQLKEYTESEKVRERMQKAEEYILNNWGAAKKRVCRRNGVIGCSAEGHVSHALSSRMSTLAMGWSKLGASKMARLREYYYNGGDMLELAKYQKEDIPKDNKNEEVVLSAHDMLLAEIDHRGKTIQTTGKYSDAITHTMSIHNRKQLAMAIRCFI